MDVVRGARDLHEPGPWQALDHRPCVGGRDDPGSRANHEGGSGCSPTHASGLGPQPHGACAPSARRRSAATSHRRTAHARSSRPTSSATRALPCAGLASATTRARTRSGRRAATSRAVLTAQRLTDHDRRRQRQLLDREHGIGDVGRPGDDAAPTIPPSRPTRPHVRPGRGGARRPAPRRRSPRRRDGPHPAPATATRPPADEITGG